MDETEVFTKVVNLAEKAGKHVELMVVPGSNPYAAIVATAQRLQSSRIVMGLSPKMSPAEQGATVGREWENLPEPRPSLSMEIVVPGEEEPVFYNLGPHPPRLWPEDLDLLHELWLELSAKGPGSKLHHRDIVGVALRRMQESLKTGHSDEVVADVMREISNGSPSRRWASVASSRATATAGNGQHRGRIVLPMSRCINGKKSKPVRR